MTFEVLSLRFHFAWVRNLGLSWLSIALKMLTKLLEISTVAFACSTGCHWPCKAITARPI